MVTADLNGTVVFLNSEAEALTQWNWQEIQGQALPAIFSLTDSQGTGSTITLFEQVLQNGTVIQFDNYSQLVTKYGQKRRIEGRCIPISHERDGLSGVAFIFQESTRQRQTEQEMQSALDYAEDILDTLRHPFLVLDDALVVQSANRTFYRMFQTSPVETVGQPVYELGNGQWNIPRLREFLEDVLVENRSFEDFSIDHDFPSLGRCYMLLNARRIYRGTNPDLILLGIEDVTEKRRLEDERREVEEHFTTVVKSIRDHAIFTMDTAGHISTWNVEAERILGFSEEEILGQHFSIIFTADDITNGLPEFELHEAREKGRAEDERWHQRKNGELFWALGIVTPVYDIQGQLTGFSKILRDITDRKEMEENLRETDRRKNQFLAMLSHELRNPLAPILNAVELLSLEDKKEDAETRHLACQIIQRQVKHLTRLVDDLLDISRVTTGRLRLQLKRICLNEVLQQAVDRIRPQLVRSKQQLNDSITQELLWIEGDAARLDQVIDNLLSNASKYSDEGGVIEISLKLVRDEAVVQVRDTGIGMTSELLPSIFDLFSQADESLDRSAGGLGIGLALVKELVEMHHGSVEAHSEGLGQGSTFTIRLPVLQRTQAETPQADCGSAKPKGAGSLKVLVVDDNLDAAKMASLLVRAWGHEVQLAHTGPDAIETVKVYQPHVVLLDIGLPGLTGYEVAEAIRASSGLADVHLVALTGYGQQEDRARSKAAGFNDHLVKPVAAAELKGLLEEVQAKRTES